MGSQVLIGNSKLRVITHHCHCRFVAAVMIWTSLILSLALLTLSCVYCYLKYDSLKNDPDSQASITEIGTIRGQYICKYAGLHFKAVPSLREFCRQVKAEVVSVSNSRSKIHPTCERPHSGTPYTVHTCFHLPFQVSRRILAPTLSWPTSGSHSL